MMNVIDAPSKFFPVKSVFVRPAEGEAGEDGALWRSMVYAGSGPKKGATIVEHIYANPARGEIRFVGLTEDGREGETETVHKLISKPLRIEYFLRDRETLERVESDEPLPAARVAIETTIALAKAKEAQECDPNFVGIKA